MATPPPIQDPMNSQRWLEWFRLISREINNIGYVTWDAIDFTGSSLTDIASRIHNSLQSIQGGTSSEYYHLTLAEYTDLQSGSHGNGGGTQGGSASGNWHLTEDEYNSVTGEAPFPVAPYTVATLPTASSYTNHIIYVSDETGGATLAFSDGTNWLRVQDRAIVS